MTFILALTAVMFLIFLVSYLKDPRKLINGLLFNIFLIFLMLSIVYLAFLTENKILMVLVGIFFIFIIFILLFGIYVLIIALLINSKIVLKHESKSPANLLTLFLALALIAHLIFSFTKPQLYFSEYLRPLLGAFTFIEIYFIFDIFNFLSISLLYKFRINKLNQDFIIVLGSGLIGDRVPPLLASRINRAIEFYRKQSRVNNPPKIIFSGGQGPDEKISEALAMQKYAIATGIPVEDTILEDKSKNTLQNMRFSKNIMDKLVENKKYNCVFVTNNFHVFRASLYARKVGLKAQGIGSKTALYYLPNAMIREYIAIVVMNKKRNLIVVSLILITCIAIYLLDFFITKIL
ncbi:YdcF family protein [Clostridium sp. LIBA-8841]|uniref:YdcF family protein n=1 Tax=Clostridium sp. LIBA-8841 TaxID=2987530 RepID=UPI002AC56C8E|nr:YdcF family protein [Clostridium sp. LIBA-8841]MDZ5252445.1 YdcF family protein [Clostridium sp. LIBA-8841]